MKAPGTWETTSLLTKLPRWTALRCLLPQTSQFTEVALEKYSVGSHAAKIILERDLRNYQKQTEVISTVGWCQLDCNVSLIMLNWKLPMANKPCSLLSCPPFFSNVAQHRKILLQKIDGFAVTIAQAGISDISPGKGAPAEHIVGGVQHLRFGFE